MPFKTISVFGLGYIGLPTAAMFASRGLNVIGVDVNKNVVETINKGCIHIVEPGLDELVSSVVDKGFLTATISAEPSDAFLIAVPTPLVSSTGQVIPSPEVAYIKSAVRSIASVIKKGDLVVLESTSPVGATEDVSKWLASERPDLKFPHDSQERADVYIAHCPERVLPGQVIKELVENDRIIGGMTTKCSAKAVELYKLFVEGQCIETSTRAAEMSKLVENSFRDVNIAFANELSIICEQAKVDVWELISLANRHPRVNILQPGPGVGGHCIAVDPWFIVSEFKNSARLIHTARLVNDNKSKWAVEQIKLKVLDFLAAHPERNLNNISITCYGLAFKADIDDLRESPALAIAKEVYNSHPGEVFVVEPNISSVPKELDGCPNIDIDDALLTTDIHVVLVDHKQFREINFNSDAVLDFKGITHTKEA